MKFIAILLSIIPLIVSFKETPKFCIHCKYFLTDHNIDRFSKCSLFPRKEDNTFVVNGIQENNNVQYYHCTTARSDSKMCGIEGKRFVPNDLPN